MNSDTSLGELLRRERKRRKESQAQAAARFGVAQSSYHRWEAGDAVPSQDRFGHIAGYVGIGINEIWKLLNDDRVPTSLQEVHERVRDLERDGVERRQVESETLRRFKDLQVALSLLDVRLQNLEVARAQGR